MGEIVNIDGTFYSSDEAKISVFDHGFLFGDSIYETMRTYEGKIFLLDRHMMRLQNSAEMLRLKLPISIAQIQEQLEKTMQTAGNKESYVRLVVTRGRGKIGLDIRLSDHASYVIIVTPLEPLPESFYRKGIKVSLVSIRRNNQATLNPKMKSSNLLNNILALTEAKERGAFEGIFCNLAGYITEATGSNVFIVRRSIIITPPADAGLLEGVTRWLAIELAREKGLPLEERNITPSEFLEAEECFITSTTKGILPVRWIDEKELSSAPGPVTRKLMDAYDRFVDVST